jgi:hypothetical protein
MTRAKIRDSRRDSDIEVDGLRVLIRRRHGAWWWLCACWPPRACWMGPYATWEDARQDARLVLTGKKKYDTS